jgi:hypothetical protein
MTMPTITDRQRHMSEARARYQASRDDDLDAAPLAELQGSYDDTPAATPPQPWSEPVERELWIDWRAVAIGIIAALCLGVLFAGVSLALTGAVFGFDLVEVVR